MAQTVKGLLGNQGDLSTAPRIYMKRNTKRKGGKKEDEESQPGVVVRA